MSSATLAIKFFNAQEVLPKTTGPVIAIVNESTGDRSFKRLWYSIITETFTYYDGMTDITNRVECWSPYLTQAKIDKIVNKACD